MSDGTTTIQTDTVIQGRREPDTKPQRGRLAAALARAQSKFTDVPKTKTAKVKGKTASGNEYSYEYKYADWSDCLRMARPHLSAEGLAFTQPLRRKEGKLCVVNRLEFGQDGYYEVDEDDGIKIPEDTAKPSERGTYLTYARRQAGSTYLGLSTDEDVDAPEENVKVEAKPSASVQPAKKPAAVKKAELPPPQAEPAAQSSENIHGVAVNDEDIPSNIGNKPSGEEYEKYCERIKVFTQKTERGQVSAYASKKFGEKLASKDMTRLQWDSLLSDLEKADKDNKLSEVLR